MALRNTQSLAGRAVKAAKATANSNIALVKYWGKRHDAPAHLNLPAVGSLSVTLEGLSTTTTVEPAQSDSLLLNGSAVPLDQKGAKQVFNHLDRIYKLTDNAARPPCAVKSENNFPTAAGLASSASGFAALTLAAGAAFGLQASKGDVAKIAREGSGSAMRSIWGGFVRLHRGHLSDGTDCQAEQLHPASHWDLRVIVVHTAVGSKKVSSREGMERCRVTSPYYSQWVDTSEADLDAAAAAIKVKDLARLGEIVEHSSCKMHACMLASRPPLLYWNSVTVAVMQEVWRLRGTLDGYVTSDAGPHVKVVCAADTATALASALRKVPGVHDTQVLAIGPDPTVAVLEK